ncbi:OmpA family protein [Rahnella inusitata]|uniref:OmpA family protein n=1 Tax=Rahnella inusitata TaxID=58169 RepID=A0ABX9NUZ9_9GAMM|nr:OmpA family protein [Rahnella inusitata]RJT09564.1 OmpA family protein [Rahnella inusitata]
MSPLRRRVLWLWAGLLAGMLCLVFLPLSPAARWLAFLLTIIICVIGLWRAGLQPDAELTDTLSANLPAENYRLPVVLVCGDDLALLFGDNAVQQTAQGCWVRVDDSGSLRQLVRQILWQRPEWINQLAMMQVVNPQQHGNERALTSALHELRWQMVQLRRDTRRTIPLVLISTVATSLTQSPVWLSQQKSQSVTLWSTLIMPETLANWQRQEGPSEQAQRLKQTALFNEHSDWLKAQVMPVLQESNEDVAPVFVQQVILHQVSKMNHVVPGSLWQRWLADRTALTQVAGWHPQADGGHLHFPEFIFPDLPSGSGVTSRRRMLRHAVTLLTLGAVIALCCSAWHNRQLLHRVAFDIRHYESIGMQDYTAKAKAVEILRQDAAQLNDWFRNGEPLRLGLGLYQGERLRLPLMAAIKNYVPPPPPPPVEKKTPKTVRLDALSLFDTGKYQLKPNSTKLLVNALIDIKAKPGWLIVVAGHTDITGDARANQILSEKRAEALRDWMLSTSDVSPTCFAVQGYGATRPIATNDTPEGRAANRRVEISLVPQANACQAAAIPHSSND